MKYVWNWQVAAGLAESNDFRHVLKTTRKTLMISQYAFAESLGISAKHLSLIENERAYPSWPLFFEMISKLGLSMELTFNAANFKQL
jgi:DNA-binding XRE family transcriptional regulator